MLNVYGEIKLKMLLMKSFHKSISLFYALFDVLVVFCSFENKSFFIFIKPF